MKRFENDLLVVILFILIATCRTHLVIERVKSSEGTEDQALEMEKLRIELAVAFPKYKNSVR